MQIVEGNAFDVLAHSSREQECVAVGRHVVEYLVDRVREAHVEHLVSLVEHHVAYVLHLGSATVHEVDEASRSSQGVNLVDNGSAAIYGYDVDALDILGKRLEVVGNL